MSLILGDSEGREWYFENILKNDEARIIGELNKSFSEIEFDFATKLAVKDYRRLLRKYQ